MERIVECVPNISEGRRPEVIQAIAAVVETVEGIRALAVDKDHQPRWNPIRVEDVTPEMVAPFFVSPWPPQAHPLRGLN